VRVRSWDQSSRVSAISEHEVIVRGWAERRVSPDRASWTISVEVVDDDEQKAFNECSTEAGELLKRLRAVIGDDGEVSTTYLRVAPHWAVSRKRYVGYLASTTIDATSPVELAGKVARAAMGDSGARINGPRFEVSEERQVKEDLLADAVVAARGKAERLASAADRRLGRVLSIREGGVDEPRRGEAFAGAALALGAADAVEPEIAPAEETIGVAVVVTFELAD